MPAVQPFSRRWPPATMSPPAGASWISWTNSWTATSTAWWAAWRSSKQPCGAVSGSGRQPGAAPAWLLWANAEGCGPRRQRGVLAVLHLEGSSPPQLPLPGFCGRMQRAVALAGSVACRRRCTLRAAALHSCPCRPLPGFSGRMLRALALAGSVACWRCCTLRAAALHSCSLLASVGGSYGATATPCTSGCSGGMLSQLLLAEPLLSPFKLM